MLALALLGCSGGDSAEPRSGGTGMLASWNDTPTRAAIIDFVESATLPGDDGYVPPAQRIAVFDNDGTLWSERPFYHQFFFALDRAKRLAAEQPGWAATPILKAAAAGDVDSVLAGGVPALMEVVNATHSGMTEAEFATEIGAWIATARHPDTGRRFRDMTYLPMRELLDYLRSRGFKVYIVSGGGIDFMRAFAQDAYGVPPENVIGSMGGASYQLVDGKPAIVKGAAIDFLDDKEAKPIGIIRHIGRRPVFVGGNSDGDFEMAEWATAGDGPRMAIFVHHTDAAREFAYDRQGGIGTLDRGLDEAAERGWILVDMAQDWRRVWPQ